MLACCGSCCACGRRATTRCWSSRWAPPSKQCRHPRCGAGRMHALLPSPVPAGLPAAALLKQLEGFCCGCCCAVRRLVVAFCCCCWSCFCSVQVSRAPLSHSPCPCLACLQLAAARRLQPHIRATLADLLRPEHLTPCVVCGDVPEDAVVSVCAHIFCAQCVATQISNAGQGAAGGLTHTHTLACRAAQCFSTGLGILTLPGWRITLCPHTASPSRPLI